MKLNAFARVTTLSLAIAVAAVFCSTERSAAEEAEGGSTASFNKGFDGLSVGALWFLSFVASDTDGGDRSEMTLKRGYLNVVKEVAKWDQTVFEARMTPDVHHDGNGDFNVRLKYLYGKFKWNGPSWKPWLEWGLVHGPWFDFEEHINLYRMQGTMFIERNHTLNSADAGVTFGGFLGPKIEDAGKYPGRYGSFVVGVYNGGGYHSVERNSSKAVEGRASIRPFPDALRGLQVSYFGVIGKGNTAEEPDWTANDVMVSFEHKRGTLTGQFYTGEGNQSGNAVDEAGEALSRQGFSLFGDVNLPTEQKVSVMGRYDYFDFDTDADDDEEDRFMVGLAWDMGHHNTILLDFERLDPRDDSPETNQVQATLQVKY